MLDRILTAVKPKAVIVSAHGLREGLLFYSKLDKRKRMGDPLLACCWDFARRIRAASAKSEIMAEWTDPSSRGARKAPTSPPAPRRLPARRHLVGRIPTIAATLA